MRRYCREFLRILFSALISTLPTKTNGFARSPGKARSLMQLCHSGNLRVYNARLLGFATGLKRDYRARGALLPTVYRCRHRDSQ